MKEKYVNKMVQKQNSLENLKKVFIPIPDDFKIEFNKNDLSSIIFIAKKENIMIELLTDGILDNNESFEKRVQKIVADMKSSDIKSNNYFYKDYKNDNGFSFKIFLQELMINDNSFVRTINAFFIEPKSKEFCQLSLSSGPYSKDNNRLISDILEFEQDEILQKQEVILNNILNNIHYV